MLKAVQFPASIADLTTGLANVNRDALALKQKKIYFWKKSIFVDTLFVFMINCNEQKSEQ